MIKSILSCVFFGSLASVIQAESLEKTFTVAVSNDVTHQMEMVQATFRYSTTTGLVGRLEGNRFVPVPFISPKHLYLLTDRMDMIRRLQTIQLPPIKIGSMTLSNAVNRIEELIRKADTSGQPPICVSYRDRKKPVGEVSIIPLDIPATNAFAILKLFNCYSCNLIKCSRDCIKTLPLNVMDNISEGNFFGPNHMDPDCCKSNVSVRAIPIVFARNGEVIVKLFGNEDWGCSIIRCYRVPPSFFKRYPSEVLFTKAIEDKMGLKNQFFVDFNRSFNLIRVDHGGSVNFGFDYDDQLSCFEEQMLAPFYETFNEWPKTCISVGQGNERMILAYSSEEESITGIWRYDAEKGVDGVLRDRFIPCKLPRGFFDVNSLQFLTHEEGLVTAGKTNEEWFAYATNAETVFRFDGQQFIPIPLDIPPKQEHAQPEDDINNLYPLLKYIVLPEVRITKGMTFTNALAYIEELTNLYLPSDRVQEIDGLACAGATTNRRIRIVLGQFKNKGPMKISSQKTNLVDCSINNRETSSALSANFITLDNLLSLVTSLFVDYKLYPLVDQKNAMIELVDFETYFSKASIKKEYVFHMSVGVNMPTLQDWERLFYEKNSIPRDYLRITYCSPLKVGIIKIQVIPGEYAVLVDELIQAVCLRYHTKRFTMEKQTTNGKKQLILVDNDTGTEWLYRTSYDTSGKRIERFEIQERVIIP